MKKSTIAAAITAIAFAAIVPFALAQKASSSGDAPPAAASPDYKAGWGMMGGPVRGQSANGTAAISGYVQIQNGFRPGTMAADGEAQGQSQGTYGRSAMSGYALEHGVDGPAMTGDNGPSWMHEYGEIWMLILIVLALVGYWAWVVKE